MCSKQQISFFAFYPVWIGMTSLCKDAVIMNVPFIFYKAQCIVNTSSSYIMVSIQFFPSSRVSGLHTVFVCLFVLTIF